jgi:hypothetical protein
MAAELLINALECDGPVAAILLNAHRASLTCFFSGENRRFSSLLIPSQNITLSAIYESSDDKIPPMYIKTLEKILTFFDPSKSHICPIRFPPISKLLPETILRTFSSYKEAKFERPFVRFYKDSSSSS